MDSDDEELDIIVDFEDEEGQSDIAAQYESLENVVDTYSFEDVGGLKEVTQEMTRYAKAIADTSKFKKYGIRPPKGMILHGPPGYGKTLLSKAFAAEINNYIPEKDKMNAGVAFAQLNLEDFVSQWLGQTTKNLDETLFQYQKAIRAAKKQNIDLKIVLYLDEMDAIGAKRDGTHEAYQKMMGVLLKHMDGMNSCDNIYWIGSTNRYDSLDSALTRPGRFDKAIAINKYDKGGIREIYKIHIDKATKKSEFDKLFKIRRWYKRI
jgi:ATP-dependent 26S proteasome regulatory subunit